MSIDLSTSGDDGEEQEKEIESENLRQKEEEWNKEKEVLSKKQFDLNTQLNLMKHDYHKLILERQKEKLNNKKREEEERNKDTSEENVEKVLQPILEQITDDTEGLLLQDLK